MAKEIKSPNPFLDDDEVDDLEFLSHPQQGTSGYLLGNKSGQHEWEDKRRQLLAERRKIEERTLLSTNTSIGILHESEQVGILTAEELMKQREQLENVDSNLDFINNTMRTSQKHINSLKSIFGGLKNYFNKGSQDNVPAVSNIPRHSIPSPLNNTLENMRSDMRENEASHPALRIRGNPFDETDEPRQTTSNNSTPQNIDEKLDKNLEFMSMGLGRLKNLAIGLNDEIELQNELIDSIHNKADKADETLEYQNRQIKRILKK